MPSSKKARAKQRKAKGSAGKPEEMTSLLRKYLKNFKTLPPKVAVETIGLGNHEAASAASGLRPSDPVDLEYLRRLADAGLTGVVMNFLNRCGEKLTDVVHTVGDDSRPWNWVEILTKLSAVNAIEISENMGTFAKYICDCDKREFFRSNMLWHGAARLFVELVEAILYSSMDAIDCLVGYDGLLSLIVGCIFWRDDHVIFQESKQYDQLRVLSQTDDTALNIILLIVHTREEERKDPPSSSSSTTTSYGPRMTVLPSGSWASKGTKKLLRRIGKTPVLIGESKEVPFIAGLIHLLKSFPPNEHFRLLRLIYNLIRAGCVDKDVIVGVIDYGFNIQPARIRLHCKEPLAIQATIENICMASLFMLGYDEGAPNDAHFAFAVKTGLFEMLLKLIADCADTGTEIVPQMKQLLEFTHDASLLKMTSKAIHEHFDITVQYLHITETRSSILESGECQGLVKIIRTIHDINGFQGLLNMPYCHGCGNNIEKKDAKQCARCERVSYCSRNCQVDHWKKTHKNICKQLAKAKSTRLPKPVTEDNDTPKNSAMASRIVVHHNLPNIALQAILKECPILDCVLVLDISGVLYSAVLQRRSEFIMEHGDTVTDWKNKLFKIQDVLDEVKADGRVCCVTRSNDGTAYESIPSEVIEKMDIWKLVLKKAMPEELKFLDQNPSSKKVYLKCLSENLVTNWSQEDLDSPIEGTIHSLSALLQSNTTFKRG